MGCAGAFCEAKAGAIAWHFPSTGERGIYGVGALCAALYADDEHTPKEV
jgi:hypothetical protein